MSTTLVFTRSPSNKAIKKAAMPRKRSETVVTSPSITEDPTKIAILGAKKAGGTTWTKYFAALNELTAPQARNVMDDAIPKLWKVDEDEHQLELSDTGDLSTFPALFCHFVITNDGFVVLYSVTDRPSLEWAQKTINQIKEIRLRAKFTGCPIILVGNKADCNAAERVVTEEEGKSLAEKMSCLFIETSATTGSNVDIAFNTLIKVIEKVKPAQEAVKKTKSCSIM